MHNYQKRARAMSRLWDRAIDAKATYAAAKHGTKKHEKARQRYLSVEQKLVAATGLDQETVRECTDFASLAGPAPTAWLTPEIA